ncbi:MAG: fibronectin type III-like domain-contianing protein [Candidatus Marinimicrobia bacterium]|nr:fibronectin type III-like domain-contianing protein [Candidatus Neomarinimicrobiota bacterium]
MAGLPGLEGGQAIADVIFGDYNPGGKLPITYPRYPNDLMTYDHKTSEISGLNRYNPQYAFGHGLSYTTFDYTKLHLSRKRLQENQTLQVRVTVSNRGAMAGKEPVLLFIRDLVRSVTPPVRQLKGFDSVFLEPGQSKTVEFVLSAADLSFIGREGSRMTEPGEFEIEVGGLKKRIILE